MYINTICVHIKENNIKTYIHCTHKRSRIKRTLINSTEELNAKTYEATAATATIMTTKRKKEKEHSK